MPDLINKDLIEGHELDTILVTNPDTNCEFEESVITPHADPYTYNHADYFEVLWGGNPHRIKPGETRVMPRFLAKHFAKHLADHILTKREEKEGRAGLMQSATERPKVLATILLKVQDYFLTGPNASEGQQVEQMVDKLNPNEVVQNLGKITDPMMGVLKPEPMSREQVLANAGEIPEPAQPKTSIWDKDKPLPTKKELINEALRLGIDITGKETNEQLTSKIKSF